jgi:hypothetical protein
MHARRIETSNVKANGVLPFAASPPNSNCPTLSFRINARISNDEYPGPLRLLIGDTNRLAMRRGLAVTGPGLPLLDSGVGAAPAVSPALGTPVTFYLRDAYPDE